MHKFWYHSPVRFYRTLAELQDMTNPQNAQYFGENKPYPLEVNEFHRFIIPNYQNILSAGDYFIYCVNEKEQYRIASLCEIVDDKLSYVTFLSKKNISGRLEIRNSDGETLFYSNCVEFLDSTDDLGRKFIRIATQHTYNRFLFDYNSPFNWIVTNAPAYCLGLTSVDADISTARTGNSGSLKIREASLDELVEYEFTASGDANILNFLQVHVTNNSFYIDGTQRTCIEKIDRDEFAMFGKLRFANIKDKSGLNLSVDYNTLISDSFIDVLSNDSKTIVYTNKDNDLIIV